MPGRATMWFKMQRRMPGGRGMDMLQRQPLDLHMLIRIGTMAFLAVLFWNCAGCGFLAQEYQNASGTTVAAQYNGLENHSVAIVVYADDSVTFMYPQVREEISGFVADQIQKNIPTARLLDYHQMIAYQDQTPNWEALPIKSIGAHFSADRVLYVEVVAYTTQAAGASDLLQGHMEANVTVYDTQIPGDGRVFQDVIDTYFPASGPAPLFNTDENTVRMDTLGEFSRDLVRPFYQWQNYDQNQQNTGNNESNDSINQ
jgi:hypothetical protein